MKINITTFIVTSVLIAISSSYISLEHSKNIANEEMIRFSNEREWNLDAISLSHASILHKQVRHVESGELERFYYMACEHLSFLINSVASSEYGSTEKALVSEIKEHAEELKKSGRCEYENNT